MSSQTRAGGTPAGPLNLGIQDLLVVGGGSALGSGSVLRGSESQGPGLQRGLGAGHVCLTPRGPVLPYRLPCLLGLRPPATASNTTTQVPTVGIPLTPLLSQAAACPGPPRLPRR